jgi:hypothetical protein
VRTIVKLVLISPVLLLGTSAGHAEDANKKGLSLDALSVPMMPADASVTFAPDQPKPGVSGPTTGYGPTPAKNGMDMPLLGLKIQVPLDSKN